MSRTEGCGKQLKVIDFSLRILFSQRLNDLLTRIIYEKNNESRIIVKSNVKFLLNKQFLQCFKMLIGIIIKSTVNLICNIISNFIFQFLNINIILQKERDSLRPKIGFFSLI